MRLMDKMLTIAAVITNCLPIPIAKRMPTPILRKAYELLYYQYSCFADPNYPNPDVLK